MNSEFLMLPVPPPHPYQQLAFTFEIFCIKPVACCTPLLPHAPGRVKIITFPQRKGHLSEEEEEEQSG